MPALKSSSLDRQEWLEAATGALRAYFIDRGQTVPLPVRVSIGFPYRGGKDTIGQCWDALASSDKHYEIFVTPKLASEDSAVILATLAHELCHCIAGSAAKHGPKFKAIATSIGLEGKMTATKAGAELSAWCDAFIADHGAYPAGKLNPMERIGKAGTRLLKCECATCGYIVRTTKKWLDEVGAPFCGVQSHGRMTWEGSDA